jgi:adenylate kinase family enzyme
MRIFITGRQGTGKSTLAAKLASRLQHEVGQISSVLSYIIQEKSHPKHEEVRSVHVSQHAHYFLLARGLIEDFFDAKKRKHDEIVVRYHG